MNRFFVLFLCFFLIGVFFVVPLVSCNEFGYNNNGVSEVSIKNSIRGSKYHLDDIGIVYGVSVYLKSASGLLSNFVVGVYDSEFELVAETYQQNVTLTSSLVWYSYSFKSNVTLNSGDYWLVVIGNSSASSEPTIAYNAGTSNSGLYIGYTFGFGLPSVIIPEVYSARFFSIFVNYEPVVVEPTSSPVPTPTPVVLIEYLDLSYVVGVSFLAFLLVLNILSMLKFSGYYGNMLGFFVGLFTFVISMSFLVVGGLSDYIVLFVLFVVVVSGFCMLYSGLGLRLWYGRRR